MSPHAPADPDPHAEVLAEAAAERLLARASVLDALRTGGSAVADLRASAEEAGISTAAFDAALAEMRTGAPSARTERVRPRRWVWALGVVSAASLLIGTLIASRLTTGRGADGPPGVPTVEEAILLHCLPPGDAAELVRPVLEDRASRVQVSPAHAPHVITIRATPALLQRAKAVLAAHDGAASRACAVRPPGEALP